MDNSKPASSGSCSDDLARARDLSRALRSQGQAPAVAPTSGYVSFPQRPPEAPPAPSRVAAHVTAAPTRASLPLMVRREPLKAPVTGFGPNAWNRLLDACVAAVAADAAFLMDPNGLIVASRGQKANDELEAIGARLMLAFDHADRIEEQGTLSMTVESVRGSLHGLRLRQAEGAVLTLGLLVPSGLTAERQARVLSLVTAAAAESGV